MNNYTVFHLHSDLSNGVTNIDSVTKFGQYVDYAKSLGMTSLGISEHGSIFEWWHKKCAIEKAGMKYIHEIEAYVTEALYVKETNDDGKIVEKKVRDNMHCVLIAANYQGFRELNKLISKSFNREDGHFYYVPRIALDELMNTSDNILISTACLGGILAKGNKRVKSKFLDFCIKNKHRVFLEIQHHRDKEGKQKEYNQYLANISNKYNIKLITGTDTHALNDLHLAGRKKLQEGKGVHFADEDSWDLSFKTYDELVKAYEKQNSLPEEIYLQAIKNTNVLADMVEEFTIDRNIKYPKLYDNPLETYKEKINKSYKKHKYIKQRYPKNQIKNVVNTELDVYSETQSIDFMLLQTYMREWEYSNGIECGYGRGSVSGSEIAYILGITQMDSIKFNLNFFRFMNPKRVTNADIDTDYSSKDREKVKTFLLRDHMNLPQIHSSEIITFNTIALKGAIRDIGRALHMPLSEVGSICDKCEDEEELIRLREKYPELFKYVDIVQGTIVSIGTHPSGVLVSDLDITEEIGLCSSSGSQYQISMLNMKELDDLMYVKLDILGLDNIGVINDTCKMLNIERLTPDNVDLDDMNVWNSMRDDTTLIFQWESNSAQAYLKRFMSDETLEKVKSVVPNFSMIKWFSFGNGLIRPACASYREDVADGIFYDNKLKELDEFLAPTMGRVTMQEDIMQFLVKFCGYSQAESDTVRRCVDENTLVMMGNGNYKKIKDINVGDNVISVNRHGVSESKPVINVFNNGIKNVYKITTVHGKEIIATSNHKLLTQDGYKMVKELKLDDSLMSLKHINSDKDSLRPNERLSCSEMFLIGMLIGDGTIFETSKNGNDNIRPSFTNSDIELINKFKECILSRIRPSYNNQPHCEFTISSQDGVSVDKIYNVKVKTDTSNKSLIRLLDRYNLRHHASNKMLNDELMSYPVGEKLQNLLGGLFSTDGGCYNNYIDYSTTSELLAHQVQSLLLKMGIYSYILRSWIADYNYFSYRVYISQVDSLSAFSRNILPFIVGDKKTKYELIIFNAINNTARYNFLMPNKCKDEIRLNMLIYNKSFNNIGEKLGYEKNGFNIHTTEFQMTDYKAREISKKLYAPYTYWLLNTEYIPLKVKSIELINESNVYDIEVEDNHNYIANGLVVHNCIAKKYGTEQVLPEIEERFIEYSSSTYNISKDKCKEIIKPFLEVILSASSYAFSWNHSDSYSCIGYICGYLRYYYPLEFLTAALNIFEGKEDKTLSITEYARKVRIPILPIKFRHSTSEYTYDKKTNSIYKGIASIKFLNDKVADSLKEVKDKEYANFIELLINIKDMPINSKQLDILVKLNFFEEFGEINTLLKQVELFNNIYDKKQFKKDKLDELEIPLDIITKHSQKITEKLFKDFDSLAILNDIIVSYKYKTTTVSDKMSYELEFLGYIQTTIPSLSLDYAYITNIDGKFKNKNVTLYRLQNGESETVKVKAKAFEDNELLIGDVIKTVECSRERKWGRTPEGEYYQKDEYETILKKWIFVR